MEPVSSLLGGKAVLNPVVYLATALLVHRYRQPRPLPCVKKGCTAEAAYVQFRVEPIRIGSPLLFGGYPIRTSAYCSAHITAVATQRGLALVDTLAQVQALAVALAHYQAATYAQQRAAEEARVAALMAQDGQVLRLSGSKGRLYQLADGRLKCELHDPRRTEYPCCWRYGAYLIDNRVGGRACSPEHNEDCPTRLPS